MLYGVCWTTRLVVKFDSQKKSDNTV
jgi:hypothetical protein